MSKSFNKLCKREHQKFSETTIDAQPFQEDFFQDNNAAEGEDKRLDDLSDDYLDANLAIEINEIDNELQAGVPILKNDSFQEVKPKKRSKALNDVLKIISAKCDLIYDKAIILFVILEVVESIIIYKNLRRLCGVDSIILIYSEKLADTVLSGKYLSGDEYTIENILELVRKFAYLRSISWSKRLIEQDKNTAFFLGNCVIEKDENGCISDLAYKDNQGLNSIRDLCNPYRYSLEDIGLFNAITEKGLKKMKNLNSKNARGNVEIIAAAMNKMDIIEGCLVMPSVFKKNLSQCKHQAYKSFYINSLGYYPKKNR